MTAKEIVKKLRQTFDELQKVKAADTPQEAAPAAAPAAPTKAKLQDGTEVEITQMAVGGIVTAGGNPLAAGEYSLEDGSILVIGDNGVIMEIKQPEAQKPKEAPAATPEQAMSEVLYKSLINRFVQEEFGSFKNSTTEKFAHYEKKFAEYEVKLAKATKVIEGLINLTQTLAEAPTGQPDPVVTGKFSAENKKETNYDILFS